MDHHLEATDEDANPETSTLLPPVRELVEGLGGECYSASSPCLSTISYSGTQAARSAITGD